MTRPLVRLSRLPRGIAGSLPFLLDLTGSVCSALAWTLATWGSLFMFLAARAFFKTTHGTSVWVAAVATAMLILQLLLVALLLRWLARGILERRRWPMLLTVVLLLVYLAATTFTIMQGSSLMSPLTTVRKVILNLCIPLGFVVVLIVGLFRREA